MLNYNSEEIQSSISKFEKMLKTNLIYFFDAQEFEDIIIHYLGNGENQLAKKALKMGLEQHPSSLEIMLLQSEVFIMDEKYEAALELLEYVEKFTPFDEEIALQKASIASKKGDHATAIECLHLALELSEDPIEIWNLLGMEHLLAEEYQNAVYFFKNCISENPDDYPSLYNLLFCYEQLDQDDLAIEALNEILEEDPYCEVAWHHLGKLFFNAGKMKEALSAFDFAIISDDTFSGAYIEKGKVLEHLGRTNEAIENYEYVLNTEEPNAFILMSIGKCHEKLGNQSLALRYFLKSIKVEPGNEKGWEKLIDFYLSVGNDKKAKFHLKNALEINSDSILLWQKSAELYLHLKKYEKAIAAYLQLLNLGLYDLETVLNVLNLQLELSRWEEALTVAEEANSAFPDTIAIQIRLLGCYLQLQKSKQAESVLNWDALTEDQKEEFKSLFPKLKF